MRAPYCVLFSYYVFFIYLVRGDPPVQPLAIQPLTTPNAATIPVSVTIKQNLTIYYGAMDENSQLFFNTTFAQTFNAFYPYFDFDYIPCQKVQREGEELVCLAPGDPKCYLDKIHACAVYQITDKILLFQFFACTMTTTFAFPDVNKCATLCGIDMQRLEACACADIGRKLCLDFNKKEISDCNTVPGFVFKKPAETQPEDFNNFENNAAVEDFRGTVCGKLRRSNILTLPVECEKKLLLGVYYNVQEEPSQKWFHAMADIYEKYASFYNIKFHPCMFADYVDQKLTCRSAADKDCVGEKMHACALQLINDPVTVFKFQTCTMSDPNKLGDFEKCANDHSIDFNTIKTCADSELGNHLCYEYSKKRPKTENIPAFAVEANFIEAISEATSKDPKFVFCQQLRDYDVTKLDDCPGNIRLSIFYESTNQEFQSAMASTILTNYEKFSPYVYFDFVPCRGVKEDGAKLKCENSLDPECTLDKFHACSIKHIRDKFKLYKVLQCMSQQECGKLPSPEACATAFEVDWKMLQTCATGDEGRSLCLENQKRAPQSCEPLSFEINDKWDPETDKQIREDFVKSVCGSLKRLKTAYPNDCF